MFHRRIRSLLYIDYDNMMGHLGKPFLECTPNWLMWLEDGQFDAAKRKRVFVEKRVYWNTPFEGHRKTVEQLGFTAILCPSRIKNKKSAADMTIALDAMVEAIEQPRIGECVLLTVDTDFEPLLEKLQDMSRRSVIMADPRTASEAVFREYTEFVISLEQFKEAMSYERKLPLLARIRTRMRAWKQAWEARRDDLAIAARHVARLGKARPGKTLGKKWVVEELEKKMRAFRTKGKRAYLDCGNYQTLIQQIADKDDRFFLKEYPNGIRAIGWRA